VFANQQSQGGCGPIQISGSGLSTIDNNAANWKVSVGSQDCPVSTMTTTQSTITYPTPALTQLGGCNIFPLDNIWNTPVILLPKDPQSDA